LSNPVKASLDRVVGAVLRELERLGIAYRRREHPGDLGIWWTADEKIEPSVATQVQPPFA
jgi:hypothetical protein